MRKILIIVNHEITIFNFRKEIVERLLDQGYQVAIMSPGGSKIEVFKEMGCQHFDYQINRRGKNLLEEFKLYKVYHNTIEKYKPMCVLTFTIKPNIYGGWAAKKLDVPFISNVTGLGLSIQKNGFSSNVLKKIYSSVLLKANRTFFQNKSNQEVMYEGLNEHNGYVLPGSGVNLSAFPLEDYPVNKPLQITYMGRLMKSKGILELIAAFSNIKDFDVELNLVGFIDDDIETHIVNATSKSNGSIKHIEFTDDPQSVLKHSDMIINPSYHEGMSNLLLEAAATGRPLLASNIPGCKEVIVEGKNGYLFESQSSESIERAIMKFLELSLSDKNGMGIQSRILVEKDFSRELVVNKYLENIRRIENDYKN